MKSPKLVTNNFLVSKLIAFRLEVLPEEVTILIVPWTRNVLILHSLVRASSVIYTLALVSVTDCKPEQLTRLSKKALTSNCPTAAQFK